MNTVQPYTDCSPWAKMMCACAIELNSARQNPCVDMQVYTSACCGVCVCVCVCVCSSVCAPLSPLPGMYALNYSNVRAHT